MENQKGKKIFRSRISVLMFGFLLTIFIPMIKHASFPIGGILVLVFVISLICGFRYVISDNKLQGKIFWIIPSGSIKISDMVSVERSYNPMSSCAASLKRLAVKSHDRSIPYTLISPVREQEFIEELTSINPNIQVRVPVKKVIWRIWDWDI